MGEMESGTCIQTGNGLGYTIRRAWSGQGWIYKNVEAFYHAPSRVCYVPEGSDRTYTASDFMELSLGQPEIAEEMFLSVGWECPASWLDEQSVSYTHLSGAFQKSENSITYYSCENT